MVGLPESGQVVGGQEKVDLDRVIHLVSYHLPRMLSDLFGVDLRRVWPRGATRELKSYLKRVLSVIHNLEGDQGALSPTKAAVQVGDLIAALFPPGMRIPKSTRDIAR